MTDTTDSPAPRASDPEVLKRGLVADAAPIVGPIAAVLLDHALNRPPKDEPPPQPKVILPPGVTTDDE